MTAEIKGRCVRGQRSVLLGVKMSREIRFLACGDEEKDAWTKVWGMLKCVVGVRNSGGVRSFALAGSSVGFTSPLE